MATMVAHRLGQALSVIRLLTHNVGDRLARGLNGKDSLGDIEEALQAIKQAGGCAWFSEAFLAQSGGKTGVL